jgi:Fe-S-cluster-containing hydrogenase component 2
MFRWLRRHLECGNPCHHCEAVCPFGAITQSGEIKMNE